MTDRRRHRTGLVLLLAGVLLVAPQLIRWTPWMPAIYLGVGLLVAGVTVIREVYANRPAVLTDEDVERNFRIARVGHVDRVESTQPEEAA